MLPMPRFAGAGDTAGTDGTAGAVRNQVRVGLPKKTSRTEWPVQAARYAVPLSDTYGAGLLLTIRIGEGVHVGGVGFRGVLIAEQCELLSIT